MPTRILVVDDHEIVRSGLRTILEAEPGWKVCGEAGDGRQAVSMATSLKPDVIVMDISMPELNGFESARQILRKPPHTEVVILTVHDSETVAREALAAGVRGYVLKSDAQRDLVAAVKAVCAHKPFFTTHVAEMVLAKYLNGSGRAEGKRSRNVLTPREREILQILAEGKTNKEAATYLGVSVNTIEAHRANIMGKLHLQSFSDLVRYAIRNNIIEA
jgi:DNA-binding NarL/FixJ family response regulator